jgi:hypothetical protein
LIRIVPISFGIAAGAWSTASIAQVMPPNAETWTGFGLAAFLVLWLTQSFSKRMDEFRESNTAANAALVAEIRALSAAVKEMPCDRVHELERILTGQVAANRAAQEKGN